ncbi:ABC transporter ATP-binding protein [Dictyobacter aurantiacus]|uniref:ABC transporter ATP-binding protein n=1 Tax=Dictyobacter aurantiacus TaxID=1936993 RepID=A0A401Z8H4_9CHLR|nr:energy-coupling factor transporter ATPase [Dictyobacter aurantiacus]GCE03161.1 ABC transporter ATP-binding protein [Dictyobacter aurantiacus]
MIEIKNATFNYSAQADVPPALRDISLTIREGETVAIIGQNGSGKSTLSRLLSAILMPQSGSVLVDGLRTDAGGDDIWTIRQRVGVVFQNPDDQLIASTVIDEVAFGPENLGLARAEIAIRVREAMQALELEDYAQVAISELSVSLKQRVAIAGVLAMRPRYLILDEPTTMISGHTANQLMETIRHLAHEQGIAVIHITHFMPEIIAFDRVIVMDAGRILMDDTPAAIFSRTDELQTIGLDVPMVTHIGNTLRSQGWPQLPSVVLSPEQLVVSLEAASPVAPVSVSDPARTDQPHVLHPLTPELITEKGDAFLFGLYDISYIHRGGTPFAQEVLHQLELAITPGSAVGLVGPTGSGKSTLIDLLAGLIKPASGLFYFDGRNTGDKAFKLASMRSRVGVVFQSPESQIFEETVGKDVSFGPRQRKVSLAESRRLVQESLEAVGLSYEDFRTRYTYALSGGQKRRVAIAGVLALQPEVIIFDEPMAGLDPRGRHELFALIRALKQRSGLTLIYASSSLKDVIELVDTIHVLDKGRLVFSGTPRETLARAPELRALDIALPEAAQIALSLRAQLPTLRTDVLDRAELEAELLKARFSVL